MLPKDRSDGRQLSRLAYRIETPRTICGLKIEGAANEDRGLSGAFAVDCNGEPMVDAALRDRATSDWKEPSIVELVHL